jgi:hypothetical protein
VRFKIRYREIVKEPSLLLITNACKIGAGTALNQSCLSRNFSIRTENAAKPAQPTHPKIVVILFTKLK